MAKWTYEMAKIAGKEENRIWHDRSSCEAAEYRNRGNSKIMTNPDMIEAEIVGALDAIDRYV